MEHYCTIHAQKDTSRHFALAAAGIITFASKAINTHVNYQNDIFNDSETMIEDMYKAE